jgi:hypothetical protein
MGWTFTHKEPNITVKKFFEKEFNCKNESGEWKILDCAVMGMKTAYMAMEIIPTQGERKVIGLVCLLGYRKNDWYNFGYKDMDETMGPCESECPKKILDLLTPTESSYALAWRARCLENLEKKQNRPRLQIGHVVKFSAPISFANGDTRDTFKVKSTKPLRFTTPGEYCGITYKISQRVLAHNTFTILGP